MCSSDLLIVPDLPPPEVQNFADAIRAGGLETVMLVAPSTPPRRRAEIVKLCSGFVYYLAVSGTTGARDALPADVTENVRQIRGAADCPVCVGFGISRPEHVAMLRGVADGAIVGSAMVRVMTEHCGDGARQIATRVADLCRSLIAQV